MKITLDWENGRTNVIEDVMDYAIFGKADLIAAVNEKLDDEKAWEKLSEEQRMALFSTVKKNIGYFESLPTTEEFYGEVESTLSELGIL